MMHCTSKHDASAPRNQPPIQIDPQNSLRRCRIELKSYAGSVLYLSTAFTKLILFCTINYNIFHILHLKTFQGKLLCCIINEYSNIKPYLHICEEAKIPAIKNEERQPSGE